VAGQWGCTSGVNGVTFNPPNESGVITAGHGGMADCGGFIITDPSIFSIPETRSNMLRENPALLEQLGG